MKITAKQLASLVEMIAYGSVEMDEDTTLEEAINILNDDDESVFQIDDEVE